MRDLKLNEVEFIYGAGGKGCYDPCGGGKGSKGHGTGSKCKSTGSKAKGSKKKNSGKHGC